METNDLPTRGSGVGNRGTSGGAAGEGPAEVSGELGVKDACITILDSAKFAASIMQPSVLNANEYQSVCISR
jgi:hypothetical protein